MDIHKPKPWHGVREFLKEYVIIVVGVLTALGAEQGVEALRWREEVRVTQEDLQRQLQVSLTNAYERVRSEPCQRERLGQVRDALRGARGRWIAPASVPDGSWPSRRAFPRVYRAPYRPYPTSAWRATLANNSLAHMTRADAARYSSLFGMVERMSTMQDGEQAIAPSLGVLAYDLDLGPSDRLELLQALAQADATNTNLSLIAAQFLGMASNGPPAMRLKASSARQVEVSYRCGDATARPPYLNLGPG